MHALRSLPDMLYVSEKAERACSHAHQHAPDVLHALQGRSWSCGVMETMHGIALKTHVRTGEGACMHSRFV